jgi:pyrroline-5-carboxylate reductase
MQVGFIGAGNVARALARGWGDPVLVSGDYDTLAVRCEVTSPGGTTARGLAALERGGVRPAFADAFDAVVGAAR